MRLVVICIATLAVGAVLAQQQAQVTERPPGSEVVIKTLVKGQVGLQITSDAKGTASAVLIGRDNPFDGRRVALNLEDAAKLADAIDAAVKTRSPEVFKEQRIGRVIISKGTGWSPYLDGEGRLVERQAIMVMLTTIVRRQDGVGDESVVIHDLTSNGAKLMSEALRDAQGINARLRTSINFEAIHKK